ncbi:MAG TPA: FAD/NAD(P)-binding protein, partial [Pirellulales bacterium]|nr:FAD/NAD(P)-binding protein [Pirellulales bacterium]
MKTIAIIGGGFSGTTAAVNLARFSESPLRVCVINSGYPVGRGAAYSTRQIEHLLNVAARNMSALADHPNHFVEWLQTRSEYALVPESELREMFVPRQVFGDYLRGLLL